MKGVFIGGLMWLTYVYVGYPALLAVIAVFRRKHLVISESYVPSVSVLIAARNEEQDIGWKIRETLGWDYPAERLDVLVASDDSDDATDEIVADFAGPRVKLIRMERRGGKARALNRLVEIARGEILFFTDANAHLGPHALRLMVRHFADRRVGCVTGDSRSINEADKPAVAEGAGVYWQYETILKWLENRLGSVLVCDGAIFCLRAGLFAPLDPELANDVEAPMRVAAAGCLVTHERGAVALERDTSSTLEEFKRRRRMCAQGMLAMLRLRGLLGALRGWEFVSHKLLRWLSLIPMLMVLGSSAVLAGHSFVFGAVLALQLIFYGLTAVGLVTAMAGRPANPFLAVPFYVVLGASGALVGVVESLLGKRFDVWEIPKLSRGTRTVSYQRGEGKLT